MLHNDNAVLAAAQGFGPATPWRYIWREACEDQRFWFKQVQQKCLLFLTGVLPGANMLDGDVLVSSGVDSGSMRALDPGRPPAPPSRARTGRERTPPRKVKKQERGSQWTHHEVDTATNLHKMNRSGKPLCQGFQRGECVGRPGNPTCPNSATQVHHCAKCLDPRHGAPHPRTCELPVPKDRRKGEGRGKGGGGH